jgi:hypothetical protein
LSSIPTSPSSPSRAQGRRALLIERAADASARSVTRVIAARRRRTRSWSTRRRPRSGIHPPRSYGAFAYAGQKCSAAARLIAVGPGDPRSSWSASRRQSRRCQSAMPASWRPWSVR